MGDTKIRFSPTWDGGTPIRALSNYTSSWSCVCWPTNLKVTDPLVNYSFSNDHIANLVQPCARIVIESQTKSLTIMGAPQFTKYCI